MSGTDLSGNRGEQQPELGPRLYVASLTDYNAGQLHGTWLDASPDAEAMRVRIDDMLLTSPTARRTGEPAEEWAIHDHEGWAGITIGEYESLDLLARLSEGLIDHGSAFAAWVQLVGIEQASDTEGFEDHYCGEHDSLEAYGESILDDLGIDPTDQPELPEPLRRYVRFDVAGWTKDMELGGEVATVPSERGVHVFWMP